MYASVFIAYPGRQPEEVEAHISIDAREACSALKEAMGVPRDGLSDLVMSVCLH